MYLFQKYLNDSKTFSIRNFPYSAASIFRAADHHLPIRRETRAPKTSHVAK